MFWSSFFTPESRSWVQTEFSKIVSASIKTANELLRAKSLRTKLEILTRTSTEKLIEKFNKNLK